MNLAKGAALAATGLLVLSSQASAQSTDEILRRLDAIEANNAKLEKENTELRGRVRQLEGNRKLVVAAPASAVTPRAVNSTRAPGAVMDYAPSPGITKAPVSAYRPFNWTGFHIGGQSGYQINQGLQGQFPSAGFDGWFFGANAGVDYQFAPHWVAGVEVDYSAADIQVVHYFNDGADTEKLDTVGTARGRLGYAWDRYLVYATGGYAWAQMRSIEFASQPPFVAISPNGLGSGVSQWLSGYAVGAGAQWAATDNLIFKAEYLYLDFGSNTITFDFPPSVGPIGGTSKITGQSVKVGAAWLFH